MATLGHIWGGRGTDPRPGSLRIYRARLRHCATFCLELREGEIHTRRLLHNGPGRAEWRWLDGALEEGKP